MDEPNISIADENQDWNSRYHRIYRLAQRNFNEKDSDKNKATIAKKLNTIIERVNSTIETSDDEDDLQFAEASLDIVLMLANIKGMKTNNAR